MQAALGTDSYPIAVQIGDVEMAALLSDPSLTGMPRFASSRTAMHRTLLKNRRHCSRPRASPSRPRRPHPRPLAVLQARVLALTGGTSTKLKTPC